jgi:nicotinamide mononucleotide transporter
MFTISAIELPSFLANEMVNVLGYSLSWLEFVGVATSIVGVALGVTGKQITWPWWGSSSVIYLILFYQWGLLASASLQVVFIAAGVMGWFEWGPKGAIPAKLNRNDKLLWLIALLILWAIFIPLFGYAQESQVYFGNWALVVSDTFLLAGSVIAQVLMVYQKFEAWILWIVVDLVAAIEYLKLEYYFTSILYVIFVAIAVIGWRSWLSRANSLR